MSIQIGWPDGASAECPSDMPSASPTTCDVAAVPRNWHPPPGDPHARQPRSAASSSVTAPCTNRTPSVCTFPASSPCSGISVTPPGTSTAGRSWLAASAIIIAGSPLSHVATPSTPRRVGSDRISRRKTVAASLRNGRLSNIAVVPCDRPSHGSVHAAANGIAPAALEHAGRRLEQQPDLPVTGVIPERDRRSIGRANAAVRREHQKLFAAERGGIPSHAGVLRPAEQIAGRPLAQHLGRQRQRARRSGARVDTSNKSGSSESNGFIV